MCLVAGGLAGYVTDYKGAFPALGGPNGLLYDLTLRTSQPWRQHVSAAPIVLVAIDDASIAAPEFAALPRAPSNPFGLVSSMDCSTPKTGSLSTWSLPTPAPISKWARSRCPTTIAA